MSPLINFQQHLVTILCRYNLGCYYQSIMTPP